MDQRQMIKMYNDTHRSRFNNLFFDRSDEDLIKALRYVVYSCERDSTFKIKIQNFSIVDNYDEINHILWEYEDAILNKGKTTSAPAAVTTPVKKQLASTTKKRENPFAFINLKDSALKLIRVDYFIQINEKKNGLVSDVVTVYIAIPRIVDGFYYKLNGNMYSAMYQIVDASTYNNSASKTAKKYSVTFKTIYMPIRVYRYMGTLINIDSTAVPATYFVGNMFKKSLLLIKYILAAFGLQGAMDFLHVQGIEIINQCVFVNKSDNYVFPIRDDIFIKVPKYLFDSIQITQSFVYTLHSVLNYMKDTTFDKIWDQNVYIKALGAEFTIKDMDSILNKGKSILESLNFIYDDMTRDDLKLADEDKADVYRVLRWMMYEFNALRQKDNLDISTKKVRYAEYLASYYAAKLAKGIYRVSDKDDRADLNTIRKAIQIPPMFLINAITKCQLVNYKNSVNDLDSLIALKYTYKGISGIGEKSNAISGAYRSIHPSHLGRVDIDSSSNSDPGVSGTICPLADLYDWHFTEYEEPSSWREAIASVMDTYRSINSKVSMYRLLDDTKLKKHKSNIEFQQDLLAVAMNLTDVPKFAKDNEEFIDGFDLFGDGTFFWMRE